ncbi:MAG: serine/threonine-protein kinase [Roseiflexus sp.]
MTTPLDLIGTTIGNYEIQALIGRGGMATVYRGFDHTLERAVAIKMLSDEARSQPGFVERFRQEARLISNLRHPNIVQVYDFGVHNGTPYMVQELLPGPTLEQRIVDSVRNGQPLPPDEVVSITHQLAAALDAAHAAGVIHRDVKPANAMWNALGALVLTDFGIARSTLAPLQQTQIGFVLGTPGYLSPEQAQGLPVTPASDLYSLGVVVFEMLAGRLPFDGDTPMSIAIQHIQTPPPSLRSLRSDISPAVEAVVLRALAKDPAMRFERAEQFAVALEHAYAGTGASGLRASPMGATGIHRQATVVWQPGAATPQPTSRPPQTDPSQSGSTGTPGEATRGRRLSLLPLLGGLFLLLLIVGSILAIRSSASTAGRDGATTSVTPVAAETPSAAGDDSAAPPQPTTDPTPSAAPTDGLLVVLPTPPAPTDAPLSQPAPPAAAGDALTSLRTLLQPVTGDRRTEKDVQKWLRTLNEFEREIGKGNNRQARDRLRALQREMIDAERSGKLPPELTHEALQHINAIAAAYGIELER